jgi:hypothetical protein
MDDKLTIATQLIGLTLLALASSYLTSIGFKFIADAALKNGYLAYLGTRLSQVIPTGLLIGVVAMLWSHLQQLINQKVVATDDHVESQDQNCINIRNAESFIKLPDTDLSTLQKNSKMSWWFSRGESDHHGPYEKLSDFECSL